MKNKEEKELTPLQLLLRESFPRKDYPCGFKKSIMLQAGNRIKSLSSDSDKNDLIEWLKSNYDPKYQKRDFQPIAKCNVIATSRDIREFDIVKMSNKVQSIFYSASNDDKSVFDIGTSKQDHLAWFEKNGISQEEFPYYNAQGINLILQNAKAIYNGVLVKSNNKYAKKLSRIQGINKFREENKQPPLPIPEEIKVFDDAGRLLQAPGINSNIYGYQSCQLKTLENKDIIFSIQNYSNYNRKPTDVIQTAYVLSERLKLITSQKGFISNKDKINLYKNNTHEFYGKRRRARSINNQPILLVANFGKDWVVFDARALLRQVYYRGLAKPGTLTIQELLQFFTADPIIDPVRNSVSLSFKPGLLSKQTLKITGSKKFVEKLPTMVKENSVGILSIDLGQTNPVSYRLSEVNSDMSITHIQSSFLDNDQKKELDKVKDKLDALEEKVLIDAIKNLKEEDKDTLNSFNQIDISQETKKCLIEKYEFLSELPFDKMSSGTTYIAEALIQNGCKDDAHYPSGKKKFDLTFSKDLRQKLPEDTRKAYNESIWLLKRDSEDYLKHAKYKQQIVRTIANSLVLKIEELGLTPVINVENLAMNGGFFDGSGKREKGWDNFFKPKKENRWIMKAFHKAFTELAPNHGVIVLETSPYCTSITCTKCNYCAKDNRNGEVFKCQGCGFVANADLDIATENLERVAITGVRLKGCERQGDDEKAGVARIRKPSKSKKKLPGLDMLTVGG